MKDSLGDRIKENYENRTRYYLPRRTYSIIRIDGKSFHNYTKWFVKPFDDGLIDAMNESAIDLCKQIAGSQFAFAQSDEISVLMTDFDKAVTESWFDNNIQKIVSVSSSIATAKFNECIRSPKLALFDARVFVIPDPVEVENYFIWRQNDWTRNSIQLVGRSAFSHKELQGKSNSEVQDMLMLERGINWNDYPTYLKRGRIIKKVRNEWEVDYEIPIFTQDRNYLGGLIPRHGYDLT